MSTPSVVDAPNPSRPRPNPGYRVAPPVRDAYAPWVSVLDEDLESGSYRWVTGADGALVPMPLTDEDDGSVLRKQWLWRRRTE